MTESGGASGPMSGAQSEFADSLKSHGALPYLFIGSGLSLRYLGLPNWEGLLRHFAQEVGEDFAYHLATVGNDLPEAATRIAKSFHDTWWKSPRYEDQRRRFSDQVRDNEGGMKVAIAEYISANDKLLPGTPGVDDTSLAREISALRRAVVDGVVTTNYDSLTDQLFPQFKPYVGQDELLMSDAQFIAETYKIHGSSGTPMSLVVTSSDYKALSAKNHYLAAKLLTIFAEHPVIFVGYSLGDEYISEILDNIATAVGSSRLGDLGKRIYFVEWATDPQANMLIEQTSIERGGFRFPITRIETHDFSWLWDVLSELDRPFPAAILRELRKHVFDLVTNPDPAQNREVVRAIPFESDDSSDYRVVFGVGSFTERDLQNLSLIGRPLQREDIDRDVLGIRERGLDPENTLLSGIVESVRPSPTTYIPVHKYLLETGRLQAGKAIDYDGLPVLIKRLATKSIAPSQQNQLRFEKSVRGRLTTPREVWASDYKAYFKLDCLLLLDESKYDLEELRSVLAEAYEENEASSEAISSALRKAICFYDRRRAQELATRVDED